MHFSTLILFVSFYITHLQTHIIKNVNNNEMKTNINNESK